ncbi:MAG: MFS transporter [Burkholderiales bacterium]
MNAVIGQPAAAGLSRGLAALLMVTIVVAAASMHFNTPMLDTIRREFDARASEVGWIATGTVAGYVIGLILLVPLGDRYDKRTLILAKIIGLIVASIVSATASSVMVIAIASAVIGALATSTQDIIPLATDLAPPADRGKIVGTMLSALMIGILVGRVGGGFLASLFGWRSAFWLAATILTLLLPMVWRLLPSSRGETTLSYAALMGSLAGLLRKHPGLRRSSTTQFLINLGYGAFWSTVALMLAQFHGLDSMAAGLIGIPGAAGVLIARQAGRLVDRRGHRPVVAIGCALVVAAFIVFGFAAVSVMFVVVGAMLLDFGIRSAQVANQTFVNGLEPAARARTNMIFMAFVFTGNAIGALAATYGWSHGGWIVVTIIGGAGAACGLLLHWIGNRHLAATNSQGAINR